MKQHMRVQKIIINHKTQEREKTIYLMGKSVYDIYICAYNIYINILDEETCL